MKCSSLSLQGCKKSGQLVLLGWLVLTTLVSLTQTAFAYQDRGKQSSETLKDDKLTQTLFTYQGQLRENGVPANGVYTFQFGLYTSQSEGHRLGLVIKDAIVVKNGAFTMQLDFGSDGFSGTESWLEVGVRPSNSADPYTALSPRQRLTSTPYAILAQAEPWSLIAVPVGFQSAAGVDLVTGEKIADAAVTSAKIAEQQVVKSINSLKDAVTLTAGDNVTITPSGNTLTIATTAAQSGAEWTNDKGVVRLTTDENTVGIGIREPTAKLDVDGSIRARGAIRSGNSMTFNGLDHTITATDVSGQSFSKQIRIGFSNTPAPNPVTFSDIKVGIGTLSPTATLHINGTTRFSGIATLDSGVHLRATVNGGARILGEQGNTSARPAIGFFSTNGVDDGGGGNGIFRPLANTMAFATASTERMRITSGGAVGIGTMVPTESLDVNGRGRIRLLDPGSPSDALVVADSSGVLRKVPQSSIGGGNAWLLIGNAAVPGNFLGTTVNVPLEVRVNNSRALLIEDNFKAPNMIGGSPANSVIAGVGGATIGGGGFAGQAGNGNTVTSDFGTVSGGRKNQAGNLATVGGGFINTASGPNSTVSGGANNTASGSIATVAGGSVNRAAGNVSFAAGCQAQANHNGSFVWADVIGCGTPFASTKADQFNVRASGGTRIFSNFSATVGVMLAPGGNAWSPASDRNLKENFVPVDGRLILQKLSLIPITEWNLKSQLPSIRHFGPMAQDFYANFGLGESDRHISTSDADGVAFASIQALYEISLEKDKQIQELQQRIEKLEKLVGTMMKKQ
ncbi:MAG: tail fiber domain-containing protein [Blastocatellia bacterium]